MGRPRTRQMDVRIMCDIWHDSDFVSLTATGQWAVVRGVGLLGRDCSLSGRAYTSTDFQMDPIAFEAVAGEAVRIGAWSWLDDDTVEINQYKDLIILVPHHRPRIALALRNQILERDGHACRECGATERLEMDHIWPWSLGGKDTADNLQTLCRRCNFRKGAAV